MIDLTSPAAPVINAIAEDTGVSNNDRITSDANLVFSGTAEANSVVELTRIGVGVIGTAAVNGSGTWSFDYSVTTLTEGTHRVQRHRQGCRGESQPGLDIGCCG